MEHVCENVQTKVNEDRNYVIYESPTCMRISLGKGELSASSIATGVFVVAKMVVESSLRKNISHDPFRRYNIATEIAGRNGLLKLLTPE